METRFKKKSDIFNIVVTALSAMLSVGVTFYAVASIGLYEARQALLSPKCTDAIRRVRNGGCKGHIFVR